MLTSFEQVRDWIKDNGFKRWVLYRDRSKSEKIIDSAAFIVSDMQDKIEMTEKYLRQEGGNAYAAGSVKGSIEDLNVTAEIRLADAQPYQPQQTAGIGMTSSINEQTLRESIRKELQAEWDKREYERKRKELDDERKEFEQEKQSAIGVLTQYLAPVAKAMISGRRMVAGVDTDEQMHADPVRPIVADRAPQAPADPQEPEQPEEENPFTDDEADKLYELLARFKKVEPQYMELIEAVVKMAESGDQTYTMAKGFLVKQ